MLRRMTGKGLSTRAVLKNGNGAKRASLTDEALETAYGLASLPDSQRGNVKRLITLLSSIRQANKAANLDDAIAIIVQATCKLLECDRATLFIVDEIRDELVIRHAVGNEDIRIPTNAGIAGAVYQEGKPLNIADAYKDPRFNKETDAKTGYKTQSILTLPINDAQGETVAVLQAINKKSSANKITIFMQEDEIMAEHMAMQVGVILSNQMLQERMKRTHNQVVSLLEIIKALHANLGINSLMFTITERSPSLVDADRCTLYLVDRARNELWSLQGAVEIRVPMDKGLVGSCATSGQIVNIKDAWEDSRFNKDYDQKSGYRTRSVLVMPIRDNPTDGSPPQMVGVLQLINKKSAQSFSQEDEALLQSFVDIAGTILASSQLFQNAIKKQGTSELGSTKEIHPSKMEDGGRPKSMGRKSQSKSQLKAFTEEEDEEE